MSGLRAHPLQINRREHTRVSAQRILPIEVHDTNEVVTSRDTTRKHMMPMDVTKDTARWLRRQLRTLRTHILSQFRYPLRGDKFMRMIFIEILVDGHSNRQHAMALFDTGCSKNLMSRTLASTIGVVYPARTGEPIMNTLGVDKFRSLGRIECRWASCSQPFDARYYDAQWEVSDKPEQYDVIIGRDTIIENKLIKISLRLG